MSLRVIIVVVLAMVLIGVASIGAIYFGLIPNPLLRLFLNPSEHSARYYPRDTLAYAWLTLYPEGRQQSDMESVWQRFNEFRAFRDGIDELKENFEEEVGISFEEDVTPWIGPELSAGILAAYGGGDLTTAATVEVRDKDSALIFLDQWLDYLEDYESADFDTDSYLSFDTWVDDRVGQAYGLSEDLLLVVFTGEEPGDVLEEMIGLAVDESKQSLANETDFQAARAALSSDRFASVYVNSKESLDVVGDLSTSLEDILTESADWPDWFVASVKWVDRGIVVEAMSPDDSGPYRSLDNPAKLLSDTTFAFVAFEDDYDLEALREAWAEPYSGGLDAWIILFDVIFALTAGGEPFEVASSLDPEEYDANIAEIYQAMYWYAEFRMDSPPPQRDNPDLVDLLDLSLEIVEELTGVDLETQFFDHLGGQTIFAVNEFDLGKIERNPEDNPIEAVLMLQQQPGKEQELSDAMNDLAEAIEDYGNVDIDPANVGADNHARIFEWDGYTPGYVLHDGYLTIATTRKTLERTVALQKSDAADLDSRAEYQRAIAHLPDETPLVAWLNLQAIFSQLDTEDTGLTRSEHRLLRQSFGNLAAGYQADGTYSRFNLVLTFFPE